MKSERGDITDPETLARHGASVRAIALAILGDNSAADDVVQETFLTAMRGGAAPVRDVGAWLRGVSRNLARRWIRTESRLRHREEARPAPVAPATPDETAARLETETALTEAVRALPEPYRTVVVLRYFDGLTTAETAARTEVPEATVKTRLRRALEMLRAALDQRYGAKSAWLPLLIRVAKPRAPVAAPVAATAAATAGSTVLAVGGVIMAKKILIVTVFAAVVAAVFVAPALWEGSAQTPVPEGAPEELAGIPGGLGPLADAAKGSESARGDASSPQLPTERFRVIVRNSDGAPSEAARVRFAGENGVVLAEARTDADGVAVLAATGERGMVLVSPLGAAPAVQRAEAIADSEVEVILPLGSVISGILYIDDEPAVGVEVHLGSLKGSLPGLVAMTDEQGGFRFTGLEPGARCYLFAGWNVHFVDPVGKNNIHLTAPATDLAIRAERHPGVCGIVVDADGKPVGGATVKLEYRTEDGVGGSHRVNAEASGSFTALAHHSRSDFASLTLTVTAPESAAREVIEVNPARMRTGSLDLGEIVLRAPRTFEFLVLGPEGAPVPGAVVLAEDDSSRVSAPTDEAGATELEVSATATSVRAGIPGGGVAAVELPDEPAGPIEVKLPGGTLLEVNVRTTSGEVPTNLHLLLEAEGKLFEGTGEMADQVYSKAGASFPGSSSSGAEKSWITYGVSRDGLVRIAGIRPGIEFRLAVVDRITGSQFEARELTLGTREHRDLEVVVKVVDYTLAVRVRDPGGKPMPAVLVQAGPFSARTDLSGIARFNGLRGEEVRVTAERRGSAPYAGTFALASLPDEIPVVLRRGRDIRLKVADASGTPVAAEEAEARAPDLDIEFQGYDLEVGVFDYRDLPQGEVRLSVLYAGARHQVVVGPGALKAEITVPATGSAIVRFEGKLTDPVLHRIRLVPTSEAAGTEVSADVHYYPERKQWEVRVPAVIPGSYRATLEAYGDRDENGLRRYQTVRTGPVIEVVADRETEGTLP